jgi:signal transduction histidine kinase
MGVVTKEARQCGLVSCLLATALCLLGAVVPAAAAAPKSVLLLAEGPLLPYGALLREDLLATLRHDTTEALNIYEELIDRTRFDSEEYDRQLVALYNSKYLAIAPALVITLTEPALDFALRHRDELFPHAALLFGAVDERMIRSRNLGANVTAVFLHYDARATVEAALRLHPGTRRIVVVGGASRLDLGYVDVVRDDLRDLASPVAATYITKQPLKAVLAVVAALRDDALVLFLSMQSDGDGVTRTGPEVLEALRSVARVPIYGMSGSFLGRGIVGGVLFDTQRHASDLAQRARQILSGVPAADLVPMRSPNRPAFDWRELKRFGIDDARLPAGATVVNRDPGLWDTYERIVLVAGAVLIGQSLLIGGLLVQRLRRRRAELVLRDLGGRLIVAQEMERARIARELHDDVSQQLAALSIALSGLKRCAAAVPNGHGLENVVSSLQVRATTLAESVRALSQDLHPEMLRHVGLGTSLTAYCNGVSRSQALEVKCTAEGDWESLSPDVALCLYRIAQEALQNVTKHAHARLATVRLRRVGNTAELTISDDGNGFDIRKRGSGSGIGLVSITERARLLSGTSSVVTTLDKGTTVRVRIPIHARPSNDSGYPDDLQPSA